jgi:hypothetical protein
MWNLEYVYNNELYVILAHIVYRNQFKCISIYANRYV